MSSTHVTTDNMNSTHVTTDNTFKTDVLENSGLILVDFWAPWCGPCTLLSKTIEELIQSHGHLVKIFKMNIDENSETPAQFSIRSIPTLIFFRDGKVLQELVGLQQKASLEATIAKLTL